MAADSLKDSWRCLQSTQPRIPRCEGARMLGVSEAELLATGYDKEVTRLAGGWKDLIKELPRLGQVMCLTRNEAAVHECYGKFHQIEFFGDIGVVFGPDIDLRLFMEEWHYGFAVQRSLQFFNARGVAIHKIFLQEDSNHEVYRELVDRFRSQDQSPFRIAPVALRVEVPDEQIDIPAFQQAWLALEDTAYFADILKQFKLRREQGLRLAPKGHAFRVKPDAVRFVLQAASETCLRIMIFVRSPGCLQIYSGPIANLQTVESQWLTILDGDFNFRLCLHLIASAWIVRKPTIDGYITSLELFDDKGENIALFFGKRGYGQQEDERWRELLGHVA